MNKLGKYKIYTPLAIAGIIFLTFSLFAIFPSLFSPYGVKDMFEPFLSPGAKHLFGTNDMGYDIFSEFIHSSRTTMTVGVLSAVFASAIGTLIGLVAGISRGVVGELIEIVTATFLLVPMLVMCIVISAFLGAENSSIIISISVMGWAGTAKGVRIKTRELYSEDFVWFLRKSGYSKPHILFAHILPNLKEVFFAKFTSLVGWAILTEASLSFLGLGNLSSITYGGMINLAFRRGGLYSGSVLWFLAPGIAIALISLSAYLVGYFFEKKREYVSGIGKIMEG